VVVIVVERTMDGKADQQSSASWREKYKDREVQLEDLKKLIHPGDRVYIGTACSEPLLFTRFIGENVHHFMDIEIIQFLALIHHSYSVKPSSPESKTIAHIRHNSLSIIANPHIREAVNAGQADFTPIKSSEIPEILRTYALNVDVVLIQISPPDRFGYCSLGINVDINRMAVKVARKVIALINPQMPRTRGESEIHISEIHYFIVQDSALIGYNYEYSKHDKDIMEPIGKFLAKLIENGSTLNVGLGKFPNAVWRFLQDKKNLGIYSELLVLTPELRQAIEKGIVNCQENWTHFITTGFVLGLPEAYQFVDQHPLFRFLPTEILNKISNIAQNHRMVSIYGALSVDLQGQVTNHFAGKIYSGIGGEYDMVMGTKQSARGKVIIVIPSTTKDGQISRIQPKIDQIAVPGTEIDFIVTEYGIARLSGKSIRERALQLISVAHPNFRKWLMEEAKKMRYIFADQILPTSKDGVVVMYQEKYESDFYTPDKRIIKIRPAKLTDETAFRRFFYHLDQQSRIYRFFTPRNTFLHEETQLFLNIDYEYNMLLIGTAPCEECQDKHKDTEANAESELHYEIVCVAGYSLDPSGDRSMAEIDATVHQNWQGLGLGRHLFMLLGEIAQERGIEGFYGEVLAENKAVLKMLQSLPYRVIFQNYGESLEFSYRFQDLREKNSDNPIIRDDRFMEFKNPI
jgi:acyl-CoA hydrolase/ribosomal protein S18 acetylase RimI-like enzyme